MTSDSIHPSDRDPREGETDAVAPVPPVDPAGEPADAQTDAVVPPPPVFDDDRAAAVVPPPPAFDGPMTGSVPPVAAASDDDVVPPPPVFEGSTGDDVVPPPPAFDGPVTGASGSGALRSSRRPVAERLPVPPPASDPEPAPPQDPAFSAPEAPASSGYGGITAAIFIFLLVLLGGAVALVAYLATNAPLPLPGFAAALSPLLLT